MTARLFDAPAVRRGRWTGNVLPVLAAPLCPREVCGSPLIRLPAAVQPALFFHGGYGAARRVVNELCGGCGWTRTATIESLNPRTL